MGAFLFDSVVTFSITGAVAFTFFMVLSVLRVYNMAHGDMLIVSAFCTAGLSHLGIPLLLSMTGAVFFCALLSALIERPLAWVSDESETAGLLFTWGLSLAIVQCIRLLSGPGGAHVDLPSWKPFEVCGVVMPAYGLVVVFVCLTIMCAFAWIWHLSRAADFLQAIADNPLTAANLGVNVRAWRRGTFVLASSSVAIIGATLAPLMSISANAGASYTLTAVLTTLALGGRSILAVALAALGIAVVRTGTSYVFDSSVGSASTYAIVVLFLCMQRRGR